MGFSPNIPAYVAISIATRNIGGKSGSPYSEDSGENMMKAATILLAIITILPLFIGLWVVFCELYGKPVHTQTTAGVITSIESRCYKSSMYYTVYTSKGYSLTIYDDEPTAGETVLMAVDKRPLSRKVTYYLNSGGQTGYCQIWPFINGRE